MNTPVARIGTLVPRAGAHARTALGALVWLAAVSCGVRTPSPPALARPESAPLAANQLEWIRVADDHAGFVGAASGRRFTPWGFNYDRDSKMRLLEDYWEAEWDTVVEDFREMRQLGANLVRVHLQLGRFLSAPGEPDARALRRLGDLLRLAGESGLYLDLTGLGCYRKADVPAWYDALDEAGRWAAQVRFWEAVAGQCADSPAVFCYNLMNEPVVPGARRAAGDWLAGDFAGFHYVQFITLDPAGRERAEIARAWVARLTGAIRARDPRHLITVGLLPNSADTTGLNSGFLPTRIAGELDFLSVHLYPQRGKLDEDLKRLEGFRVGKPLVVEEVFPLNCPPAELREFIHRAGGAVAGWVGFYWGQTPAELQNSTKFSDALTRQWLELFQQEAPRVTGKP